MINKNDLRKAISSIAINNAKRNTIYKAFSDLDSITKEEFDSVKSDISKVVESMLTKDTVGKANGVASLDSNGSVPIEQLGNIDTTLFLIVRELPTDDIKSNKIYLVPNEDGQGNNVYIEYLYVEDVWEKVGEFKPDINYDEIISKVEEKVVSIDNNNNIIGSFYYRDDGDGGLAKQTFSDSNRSIAIGFSGDLDNECEQCICIGYGNVCNGLDSIAIGENVISYSNSVCIGRDIASSMDSIVLGQLFTTEDSDDLEGRISIGWKVRNNNISNVIYQIGGYNNNNSESYYNLEETLTYDNQHKKYIYGIGGYDGTNSDAEGVKSLQEVLADKADVSAYYTKTEIDGKGYLTAHQSLDNCVKIGNDTTPTQLFKGQGSATINAKQLLLNSPSGGVNIQPDSINIGSSSFTFKANPTEGLGFIVNTTSKGMILTPQGGVKSIGFDAKSANVEKGGSLVGQNVAGAVYNVNGNFVNLNPLYNLESKFRDTIAIHVALDNITDASTPEEVVTKFNQLLKSLKAIGLMKPDATAE